MNFYNENDPRMAAWLRELIARKLIPDGVVDERSITDIHASDLEGFTQCHFFAGIGGWSLALQLAGWPSDRPVWTGSCPCQPYSAAGKGLGDKDPRNLWPAFFRLIRECRPVAVFGEQVESAIGHGWLDGVSADLEGEDYSLGAVVLGAHSVRSPHIRQRLFWVADSQHDDRRTDQSGRGQEGRTTDGRVGRGADSGRMADAECGGRTSRAVPSAGSQAKLTTENHLGPWAESHWLLCRDGKHRRVPTEPALFPLADGLPYKLARRGSIRPALLRGAGNAIVPEVAAEFIRAYLP